jgi:hypothetical protein
MIDFKMVSWTGQMVCQGTGQKFKFLSPTKPRGQFFVLHTSCLKYQNNLLSTKHYINIKFVQYLKLYSLLFSHILLCSVFIFCRSKDHKNIWLYLEWLISKIYTRQQKGKIFYRQNNRVCVYIILTCALRAYLKIEIWHLIIQRI